MKRIKLTQGRCALVDTEDFEWLSQWKWHFKIVGYACRTEYIKGSGRKNQKSRLIYMHREINHTSPGFHTDHINGDRLDNRRNNLRTVTCSENLTNSKVQTNNTSGYKGIHWYERKSKWQVYIHKNRKRINLGYFAALEDAVIARREAEKTYHAI